MNDPACRLTLPLCHSVTHTHTNLDLALARGLGTTRHPLRFPKKKKKTLQIPWDCTRLDKNKNNNTSKHQHKQPPMTILDIKKNQQDLLNQKQAVDIKNA